MVNNNLWGIKTLEKKAYYHCSAAHKSAALADKNAKEYQSRSKTREYNFFSCRSSSLKLSINQSKSKRVIYLEWNR